MKAKKASRPYESVGRVLGAKLKDAFELARVRVKAVERAETSLEAYEALECVENVLTLAARTVRASSNNVATEMLERARQEDALLRGEVVDVAPMPARRERRRVSR